jgi:hypothetical protein
MDRCVRTVRADGDRAPVERGDPIGLAKGATLSEEAMGSGPLPRRPWSGTEKWVGEGSFGEGDELKSRRFHDGGGVLEGGSALCQGGCQEVADGEFSLRGGA